MRWRKVESMQRIGQDVVLGEIRVDPEVCSGCGFCVQACPANSLELNGEKARMVADEPLCMSCGDCAAICPEDAIEIVQFIEFRHYFRYLDRGKPAGPRCF